MYIAGYVGVFRAFDFPIRLFCFHFIFAVDVVFYFDPHARFLDSIANSAVFRLD